MRNIVLITIAASALLVPACATTENRGPDYGPNPYRFPELSEPDQNDADEGGADVFQVGGEPELTFEYREPFLWRNFGGNPHGTSREDAMEKIEDAVRLLPVPQELHEEVVRRVRASAGQTQYLVPGDRLDASLSGGVLTSEISVHYNVTVVDAPGSRNGLSQAIRAEVWEIEFEHNGQRYVLEIILPEVCYNWSVRIRPVQPPAPPAPECAVVAFNVNPRDVVLFAVQHRARAITSECWGVRLRDSSEWSILPVHCDACPEGWSEYIDEGFPGRVHASGAQGIGRSGVFEMRVPQQMLRGFITFCITREFGDERRGSCSLHVEPRDWRESPSDEFSHEYFIDNEYWNFTGRCNWVRVS